MTDPKLSAMAGRGIEVAQFRFPPDPVAYSGEELMLAFEPRRDARFPAVVCALLTNDKFSVGLVLRALLSGSELISVPLPSRGLPVEQYAAFVQDTLVAYGCSELLTAPELSEGMRQVGIPCTSSANGLRGASVSAGAEFSLTQFSSGSTGAPHAVKLGDSDLGGNVRAMLRRVRPRPGDSTVSWLPLSHDLGLVGMLLTSLAAGEEVGEGDIVLLRPEDFLRAPSRWIDALSTYGGTFTASPTFGYHLAAERGRVNPTVRLDSMRCAIVGGEMVSARTLDAFGAQFASNGFNSDAFCPAYGLAEVGLCVTMVEPSASWSAASVDQSLLLSGRLKGMTEGGVQLVSAGPILEGYEISIAGGMVGEVRVKGPSTSGRWVNTGDVGFMLNDEFYPCGRTGDQIVVHGRRISCLFVEERLSQLDSVRSGRACAVGNLDGSWAIALELADESDASQPDNVMRDVTRVATLCTGARPATVVIFAKGTLPMTSSGKLQRGKIRQMVAEQTV